MQGAGEVKISNIQEPGIHGLLENIPIFVHSLKL